MSATNRGATRIAHDNYPTPAWCVHRLLDVVSLPNSDWLEPCAGDGAIIRAVRDARLLPDSWTAVELREECREALLPLADQVAIADFLSWAPTCTSAPPFAVAITNPPYSLARQIIDACLPIARYTVMLLRLNFLGSAARCEWWRSMPRMPDIYVLPNRPSFCRNEKGHAATDACEYGWYVWGPESSGRVRVLPQRGSR